MQADIRAGRVREIIILISERLSPSRRSRDQAPLATKIFRSERIVKSLSILQVRILPQ
jgi:hypothetical protein